MRRGDWFEKLEAELALTSPVTIRCARCAFVVELPIAEARQAFAEHECGPAVVPAPAEASRPVPVA